MAPYKILVVDDEEDVRDVLKNFLFKRFKAEVQTSGNGLQAVEITKTFKPDLILLDIHLPGHMGWDVLREIRQFDTAVKILVVTALYVIPPEHEDLILGQTSGYLNKPIELDALADKVRQVLE